MNTNTPSKTTEIALILDQSGSVESIRAGTIEVTSMERLHGVTT
jgi:hypothetical protein